MLINKQNKANEFVKSRGCYHIAVFIFSSHLGEIIRRIRPKSSYLD